MGNEFKLSQIGTLGIIAAFVGMGLGLNLMGVLPTILQGVFVSFTAYSIIQNLKFIVFNFTGKVSDITREVWGKKGKLSKSMNLIRMIALAGMILEGSFTDVEVSFVEFQIVIIFIALNVVVTALALYTAGRAAKNSPDNIANLNVTEKHLKAQELENQVIEELRKDFGEVELPEEAARRILYVITSNSEIPKTLHKICLIKESIIKDDIQKAD